MKQARTHACYAVAGKAHHAAHANDLTGPAKVLFGRIGMSQYRRLCCGNLPGAGHPGYG
jgi:hypothetical protein